MPIEENNGHSAILNSLLNTLTGKKPEKPQEKQHKQEQITPEPDNEWLSIHNDALFDHIGGF